MVAKLIKNWAQTVIMYCTDNAGCIPKSLGVVPSYDLAKEIWRNEVLFMLICRCLSIWCYFTSCVKSLNPISLSWQKLGRDKSVKYVTRSANLGEDLTNILSDVWYKVHLCRQWNCWSFRCSWSITCLCCFSYNFIVSLTRGFNGLGKDNCKMRQETFKFWDLVCLILEVWQ